MRYFAVISSLLPVELFAYIDFPVDTALRQLSYLVTQPGAFRALVSVQARRQPVDLSSFDPPLARRFAWEQLDLVNQGWSPRQARAQLEERYPPAEM